MAHFFEKQRVDQVGFLGVKLQKILIFLMVVNFIEGLFVGLAGWFWNFLVFVVLYIGFWGAYKRNYKLLRFYYVFNIVFYVMIMVLSIVAIVYILVAPSVDYASEDDTIQPAMDLHTPNGDHRPAARAGQHDNQGDLLNLNRTSLDNPYEDTSSYYYEYDSPLFFVVGLVYWLFSIVVLALKIVSIVLAGRMARMLKDQQEQNLAIPVFKVETKKTQAQKPSAAPQVPAPSAPVFYGVAYAQPNQPGFNPFFAPVQQPMYYPQPYVQFTPVNANNQV